MSNHDIDVSYYLCDEKGCDYKAKKASHVERHKAGIHGIDVIHYLCLEKGCEYRTKQGSDLKSHIARIHGRFI